MNNEIDDGLDTESGEHYYQNQTEKSAKNLKSKNNNNNNVKSNRIDKNKKQKSRVSKGLSSIKSLNNHLTQIQMLKQQQQLLVQSSSNSSGITSSSSKASSDRALLPNQRSASVVGGIPGSSIRDHVEINEKKINTAYCFLVFSIFFLALSLITIAITFIFPFWITLTINTGLNYSNPNNIVNVINKDHNLSLITTNSSDVIDHSKIIFDLGLWEVKMHQTLIIKDLSLNVEYLNMYPQSMLWLNADLNDKSETFLMKLLQFINLKSYDLFIVQILEIIHLIFIFLTFCFQSYTLCLCSDHKSSLCWYLVCLFLCIITFLTGLSSIILIVMWQMMLGPFVNIGSSLISVQKTFSWCFWVAVGINSSIFLAAILILLYLIITTVILYKQSKERKNKSIVKELKNTGKLSKVNQAFQTENGITTENIAMDIGGNYPRLPRLQTGNLLPISHGDVARSTSTLQDQFFGPNSNGKQNALQPPQQLLNPSYIFYTGHGNYRKQSISIEKLNDLNRSDYEPPSDFINAHGPMIGYPTNQNNTTDHPYSNVVDQLTLSDLRYYNYR